MREEEERGTDREKISTTYNAKVGMQKRAEQIKEVRWMIEY